jgi:hypothetical protein
MRSTRPLHILLFALLLAAGAFAQSISGTVTNATSGKPAAGTTVTLVDPMGGMAEIGTAKTDAQGRFKFEGVPAAQGPRLARAEKSGVNYFKMVPPGLTNVDLSVYDAASSVEGISGSADVVRLQAQGSTLEAVELFAIKNESNPPRTLASPATFEFVLPEGALIDGADAQAPNGQPISAKATPAKEKNHYSFAFAIKPGETRFQVAYHLPYSGKASFAPRLTRNFEHYVLVLPSTMSFAPRDAQQFQAMKDQAGVNVQVSVRAQAGQDLSYDISGTGTIRDPQADATASDGGDSAMGGQSTAENRPGGGLGKPIDAPDGLAKYRWYILGLLLTILVGGGIWTRERTLQAEAESGSVGLPSLNTALEPVPRHVPAAAPATKAQPASQAPAPSNLLLAALKEELFALEVERQQGKLTPQEYEKARAALEQTLQRALARTKS